MEKRFIAFYDALCFSIIAVIMWTTAMVIFITGHMGDFDWCVQNWYLVVTFAICIAVPVTIMLCLQKITIDLSCDMVELFYLVNDNKNERDYNSNWNIYPSEIESIEVVKLSKEEKRRYTSARFLFSKYLKVNMKFGHCKYVYVSHYSNHQIKKIIKMLTKKVKF
jgi:hypothetical protein